MSVNSALPSRIMSNPEDPFYSVKSDSVNFHSVKSDSVKYVSVNSVMSSRILSNPEEPFVLESGSSN